MSRRETLRENRRRTVGGSAAYLSRGEWIRLAGGLFLVSLILIALRRSDDATFWSSLLPDSVVDTKLPAKGGHVELVGDSGDPEVLRNDRRQPPVLPELVAVQGNEDAALSEYNPLKLSQTDECREIDTALLQSIVKDKTPWRSEESDLIYQMLCVASTTPPGELAKRARKDVLFINLATDPKFYRGTPIHLRGVLHRLYVHEGKGEKNAYGFSKYYEGWMSTDDQPGNYTQIVFAAVPEGLTPGERISEEIEIDAFFLKLVAFRSRDGVGRFAPLLVGYKPRKINLDRAVGGEVWGIVAMAATILAIIASYVAWQRRKDRLVESRLRPHAMSDTTSPASPWEADGGRPP